MGFVVIVFISSDIVTYNANLIEKETTFIGLIISMNVEFAGCGGGGLCN